ncbi:lipoprotein NlpD [Novimethylophilus kurashikiensis]|uniref:Lipoprotein NlpD n=1 Tax=Novimethylophilus kurashikiensis TaxID=1825523 RepID=A0A2R5FH75_9PROT|nr:peptidoglycan DD-metalloendopeptidase family protein [Novimethylophilus kurashikiensis]GBG15743.1 lipoprotein NlpD [Novimethylophilus kurashikiensis]
MRIGLWLIVLLLAACSETPTHKAPVIERLPQSTKKTAPAPATSAKPATPAKAPVAGEKDWRPDTYTVKKGDTLYSIGLEFGYDYKDLAQLNHIVPPYKIYVGQTLKIKGNGAPAPTAAAASQTDAESGAVITPMKSDDAVTAKPLDQSATTSPAPIKGKALNEPPLMTEPKAIKEPYSLQAMQVPPPKAATEAKTDDTAKATATVAPKVDSAKSDAAKSNSAKPKQESAKNEPDKTETAKTESGKTETSSEKPSQMAGDDDSVDWAWPAQGKVLGGFGEAGGTKGIDIAGTSGQPVYAAAAGKVVYSGSGLRGYGKLVIIKHNKTYLSAYAHNNQILVKEGQEVTKGQKIAEMGNTDADQVKLHFEIRKLGKPVDPTKYLSEKP